MSAGAVPHVVIVGGGFGGLYAARELARLPVRVTILDRQNYHLFQPMLYQVASAALNPSDIAFPIRAAVRGQANTEVLLAEAERIDKHSKEIHLTDGSSITYDYCIVATGLQTSYFGHDEWVVNAPGLKSMEDALEIRRRVLLAFERAEREPDPVKRHALLTFVVVGGGPTGVEVAGAIAELRRYALARDFRHIDPREATVLLLEGGQRILPSFPPKLSAAAKRDLRRLGVDVRTEMLVTDIRRGLVSAAGWTIPTHTVIWAAGMRATPIVATLNTPTDRMGRVIVEPDCSIPDHPEVFVLGDAAHIEDGRYPGGLPGVAQVAMQSGTHVGRLIARDLAKKPRTAFSYFDKGQLAVIGRGRAVADTWRFEFGGFLAWLIWAFIHVLFLIGFRNRVSVMLQWAWSYANYHRGARLITGSDWTREHPIPAAPSPGDRPPISGPAAA